jgi:uncharacterized membrane protein
MSEAPNHTDESGLRTVLLIAYGLFLLAPFNGITVLAGVVLAYVKRGEARGTVWESHARNLIHVFWIGLAVSVAVLAVILWSFGGLLFSLNATNGNPPPAFVGALVVLVPALWLICVVAAVWYFYRTLRGLIRAIEGKAY